jgi:hypothetical protein
MLPLPLSRFEIRPSSLDSPFKVHPTEGVIQGRQFQVLGYRFLSGAEGSRSERVLCFLNNSPTNATELRLTACTYWPRLELTENANLKFRPTCAGSVSERSFTVRNLVKIPVRYSWGIPEKVAGLIGVRPAVDVLKGSESKELTWSFAPKESGSVKCKVHCLASGVRDASQMNAAAILGNKINGGKASGKVFPLGDEVTSSQPFDSPKLTSEHPCATQRLTLSVSGEGITGAVRIEPEKLDLGTILVGSKHRETLTLHNLSDGQLQYVLESRRAGFEGYEGDDASEDTWLRFDAPAGTIPARSSVSVQVSVRPVRRAELSFEVSCRTVDERSAQEGAGSQSLSQHDVSFREGSEAEDLESSWQASLEVATCLVAARADFPTVTVVDVRSDGVSKDQLWRQLRIGDLNEYLAGEPGALEKRLNSGKESADWAGLEEGLERNEIDLGAALVGGKRVRVHMEVKNTGTRI